MKTYKCLSNNPGYWLTPGRIYLVEKSEKSDKLIINDKGFEHFISDDELEDNFSDIEQEREDKLNKLGI